MVLLISRLLNSDKATAIVIAMKFLITLIGLILVLEGLPYVAFPEAMQRWMRQIIAARPAVLRTVGLVAVALGLLLCYITQRTNWIH